MIHSPQIKETEAHDWITYRYKCEKSLGRFVVEYYQHMFKDLWKQMFKIDPKSASLIDLLRIMRNDWFTFSDLFGRNSNTKTLIDRLYNNLMSTHNTHINGSTEQMYKDLKQLIAIVNEKWDKCGSDRTKDCDLKSNKRITI